MMESEHRPASLRVGCPCGKWIPIDPGDAGRTIACSCGRRLEVPLLSEFDERTDLLTSSTVEDRIRRLIAEGELPRTGGCARCGEEECKPVSAILDCERYTAHQEGGMRFIYLPFLFWVFWQEEESVEIRGRDTIVPAPISLCTRCQSELSDRPRWMYLGVALAAVVVGVLGCFLHIAVGIAVTLIGILAVALWKRLATRARQRELKEIIKEVPVYRQLLSSYPYALVILPQEE